MPSDQEEPGDHTEEQGQDRTRHVPKRACNECRQQKLRCDVVPEPFSVCSRCKRLKLECRIDANFKRIGKRSKNAEMEREIADLRRRLQVAERTGSTEAYGSMNMFANARPGQALPTDRDGVANSLLNLRRSGDYDTKQSNFAQLAEGARTLGTNVVYPDQVNSLFQDFLRFYHPFLPVLDPEKSPDHYFDTCPLLFWTVILVAARRSEDDPMMFTGLKGDHEKLLWSTIASVPQNYLVVKALAILCTWPWPTPSTSSDQTFILSGTMRQLALQTGLHRPMHVQDFSRNKVDLREEEIQDRLKTWAICNIVIQNVSTAYGQPAETLYDYTLTTLSAPLGTSTAGLDAIYWPLQIERFNDKVSRQFYNNPSDALGISSDQERATWISLLVEDYRALESHVTAHGSSINALYLKAAGLHLRLSAFFDSITSPNYITDLLELYNATAAFLRAAFELETEGGAVLKYASRHIVMMILAAGFTLLKLLNSFFARHIDVPASKALFSNTIRGIRTISIANNDLPARLAEVLAQLWHSYGAGMRPSQAPSTSSGTGTGAIDGSLQLRVRSRMSMSLIYDSVWRWREEFQFKGDGTTAALDSAVNNPTVPDVSSEHNTGSGSAFASRNASGSASSMSLNGGGGAVTHGAGAGGSTNANLAGATASPLGTAWTLQQLQQYQQQQQQQSTHNNNNNATSANQAVMLDPSMQDTSIPSSALNLGEGLYDQEFNLFDPLAFMLDVPGEFPQFTDDFDMDMDMHMRQPFG